METEPVLGHDAEDFVDELEGAPLLAMGTEYNLTRGEIASYYEARMPHLKQRRAAEWRGACPIHHGKNNNFAVEAETGRWYCHSTCGRGGDIFALEAALTGANFPRCKTEVLRLIGRTEPEHWRTEKKGDCRGHRTAGTQRRTVGIDEEIAQPEPKVRADLVRQQLARGGFHAVAEHGYGDFVRKVRFEHKSTQQQGKGRPEKVFRWEHQFDGIWYSGDGGGPKPLYVNSIFRERDQVGLVLGVEGEAKADVAGELGFAAFSFKDMTLAQVVTLADCSVVLWPDNDESGRQQTENAARTIDEARQACGIGLVVPPPELPPAGDIIDAVRSLGWDGARVAQFLQTARPYSNSAPSDPRDFGGESDDAAKSGRALEITEEKQPARPFPFQISEDGIFFLKQGSDETVDRIRLAARVEVVAKTRDESGENWGRLLRWWDDEGRLHQWAMPMEALATDQGAVRARLLSEGLPFIITNTRYRERFSEYLQNAPAPRRVCCVARVGWQGAGYVLPDETIGPEHGEQILYQPPHEAAHHWNVSGTAEQWRELVGRRCSGNSRLIMAVACAFAGPTLHLVGAESGGIHFHGGSSTGKSTALIVGGSVCGGGARNGFVQTWRTTVNGLEAIAEAHNDGSLFLDELSQVDPREAAEVAYLLGNGQGKVRMTRGITVRKKLIWTLLYVSAGELTLAEHAASAGKRTKGGAEVRLLNIEADAGRGLGLFETLHGAASPDAFADDLRDAARRFYGTPLRAFVKRLARDQSGVERALRANKHSFIQQFVPTNAAGEVRRAADRFAIIGAAGELATEWALTGWRPGEAIEAAQRCLQGWIASRGTAGASDLEVAIRQVRAFLEAHGASRFQLLNHSSRASEADSIIRRAGFKRTDENGGTEYLILRETFRTEVCAGHSYQSVAKELEKRDFLVREGKEMMIKPRLPELGTTWVYCIRAAILESDEC